MASQVETLANLCSKTEAFNISDETKSELCDWLMSEFQQFHLNLQFSDYMQYQTVLSIFAKL